MNNSENKKQKKKLSKKTICFLGIGAIVIIFFSAKAIFHAYCYDSTDDAQIDGNIIPLRTMVTGYVKEIRVADNQQVKQGDTLVIFDTTDLKAKLHEAEALLAAESSGLELNREQLVASRYSQSAAGFSSGSAKEKIDAAKAKVEDAEKNFNRIDRMFAKKAATQQAYDNAQTTLTVARAQLAATRKQYQSVDAQSRNVEKQVIVQQLQVEIGNARIKKAKAQLIHAQYLLEHAFVTAPCDGFFAKKTIEVGQFVQAGTAMATLINPEDVWVTANFKETQLKHMKEGQTVNVKVDAFPGLKIQGVVQSFCAATGAKFSILPAQNATGNFIKVTQRVPVRIAIKKNSEGRILFPGMSVIASVKTK